MKYSIGYQLPDEFDSTLSICEDYRDNISSVYFSYGSEPSGRLPLFAQSDKSAEMIKDYQLQELKEIGNMGISLTLLLNANCYGDTAVSDSFKKHILELVGFLKSELNINSVTTTSPFIAESLKSEFCDSLYVCASVNMRIDNVITMQQLSKYFDGFYIRKEVNRNFDKIRELKAWCNDNGKNIHLLANSGCLTYCGFQTFHDNLVAHQSLESVSSDVKQKYPSPCWEYLASLPDEELLANIMRSTWIRPEDVSRYEEFFSEMKLATRMHQRPRMVVAAYARERFRGNITDLTEPSYSSLFKGKILDNTLLTDEWFDTVLKCNKACHTCNFCRDTAQKIKLDLN